ncbi:MAG: alpha/beta hydrolase [Pseudomonadota bacterium]
MRVLMTVGLLFFVALLGLSGCATINAEKNAPAIGSFVDVEGERLHVLEKGREHKGKAPSIILIHGASINLRDMDLALGEELSGRYHVMMVDRPGRGYSTRPDDGHRLETQAALIRDASQQLGVENPVVVGQSFGGAVSLAYALQYQEEMAGLVVLAGVSHEWPGGVAWYNNASSMPVVGFFLRRLVIPVYGQFIGRGSVESSFEPDPAPENYYERVGLALLFRPKDFKSNAADIANLKKEIVAQQDQYAQLRLPVAILTGADDKTVSPEIHSETLARQIEGATLQVLPDTGHALHHAETRTVIEAIDAVVARAGAAL